jgi:adenylate cyclase
MTADTHESSRWPDLQRVRRAIVVVDVVESVRLMQQHEDDVIDRWRRFVHEVRTEVLPAHGGRMVKSLGDGMLLAFDTARAATAASLALHRAMAQRNRQAGARPPLALRAGAHWAEVVEDELDVFGAGVNLAARLASAAQPGGIVVSAEFADGLQPGLDAELEDLGELHLKHMERPVRAFAARDLAAGEPVRPMPLHPADDLRPGLAIVPFACRDGSDPSAVMGDLIADEVTLLVSRCPEWRVISKLSSSAFAGRDIQLDVVGARLRVDYLCTGSYHRTGVRLDLLVQLVHVGSGEVVWSDRVGGQPDAILAGTDPLCMQVGESIGKAIFGHGIRAVASMPLPQLRSHELLLGAVAMMHRARKDEFDSALQWIEHLQQRHPRASQPHAWRAKWHVLRVVQGWSEDPHRDGALALQAGRLAADSDTSSSLALAMQGLVQVYLRQDFDAASRCYDDALQLNPNESLALLLRGTMHAFAGDGAAAYGQTQQALRLSPLDPLRYFYLSLAASAAITAGRHDEAIELAQASLRFNRVHLSTYRALAIAQQLSGRHDEAALTVQQLLHHEPGFTVGRFLDRFPGRERAPDFARRLADALAGAGLPA